MASPPSPTTTTPMVIRVILPEEHEALGDLIVAAYHGLPGYSARTQYDEELRNVAARSAEAVVLVAVEDGELLGGVTYVPGRGPWAEFEDDDAAGIRMLAVPDDARRRGVGRALLMACIDRARYDGRARIVLHSTQFMTAAHRLYAAFGFERAPHRDWRPVPNIELRGYELAL